LEAPHKHSDAFDSILRSKLTDTQFGMANDCPDASLLAALYEGTLTPLERARMQGHLDSCPRCQAALAAIARADDDADHVLAPRRSFEWRRLLGFGLPAAAVAAIAIVIVVRARNIAVPPPSNELAMNSAPAQAVQSSAPAPMPAAPGAGAAEAPAPQPQQGEVARAESANGALSNSSEPAAPPAPPAAAPPASAGAAGSAMSGMAAFGAVARRREYSAAAAAPMAAQSPMILAQEATPAMQDTAHRAPNSSFTVQSPDNLATWVIGPGGNIVKHTHSGHTLTQTSGVKVELLAASAPSPRDCWIVGRNGTVLRTRDGGGYWENVVSPTTEDIVHVRAADAHNAVIRTASGKSYATTDGGATWHLQ
jgi:hypothetical protein